MLKEKHKLPYIYGFSFSLLIDNNFHIASFVYLSALKRVTLVAPFLFEELNASNNS